MEGMTIFFLFMIVIMYVLSLKFDWSQLNKTLNFGLWIISSTVMILFYSNSLIWSFLMIVGMLTGLMVLFMFFSFFSDFNKDGFLGNSKYIIVPLLFIFLPNFSSVIKNCYSLTNCCMIDEFDYFNICMDLSVIFFILYFCTFTMYIMLFVLSSNFFSLRKY